MRVRLVVGCCAAVVLGSFASFAAGNDHDPAAQGYDFLKKYCYRCHGVSFEVPRYNVLDRDLLVAPRGDARRPRLSYIKPGDPTASLIWKRVAISADMPPDDDNPRPTDAEKTALKHWIESGAPFPLPERVSRNFLTEVDVLRSVRDDLRKARNEDRPFFRYFTLANLSNNRSVQPDDLKLALAALSKLVNSLSYETEIVVPRAVDPGKTVLAVDLRDLGWDRSEGWQSLLRAYPYGLTFSRSADESVRDLASEVEQLSGTVLPYLRADWFVAHASRPPFYRQILKLPETAAELEQQLRVDVSRDLAQSKVARSGFAHSGVSAQNRVVERHSAAYGAYWRSFDFRANNAKGSIFEFPLGPDTAENPSASHGFHPDGGEILFNLPNGLQGYMLVDGKGKRIDDGPIDIVEDSFRTSGTPVIVAGLSCMACHKHGVIGGLKDEVRGGHGLDGAYRDEIDRLYLKTPAMDALIHRDEDRFLRALDASCAPFLKDGESRDKDIRDFAEPISDLITRRYNKDVTLEIAAQELGLADPATLEAAIRSNPALRRIGLGPLGQKTPIKRDQWESLRQGNSLLQEAALTLRLATPFHY